MTLREFFDLLGDNPAYLLFFFAMLPITALLAGLLGKDEGHLTPWKYLYSALVYLACVPGIFAVALSIYLFLFERRSIFDTDVYTQVLPIFAMVLTLFIIRKNVDLDNIPGFGKLSGLVIMIITVLFFMWIIDKTRIFVFSYLPFQYVILIFIGLLIIFRIGWSRLLSR